MKLFALFLLIASVLGEKYYFRGTFNIPYANVSQPLEVNVNGEDVVWNFFDGLQVSYFLPSQNDAHLLHVRKDHMECVPLREESGEISEAPLSLPDISTWEYAGRTIVNSVPTEKYVSVVNPRTADSNPNLRISRYEFYQTPAGVPVRWVSLGKNGATGSHYDHYSIDYQVFRQDYNQPGVFTLPHSCSAHNGDTPDPAPKAQRSPRNVRLISSFFTPASTADVVTDESFVAWAAANGKTYATAEEAAFRQSVYMANSMMIDSHNARTDATYTMAMNQFGDLTHSEIVDIFGGHNQAQVVRSDDHVSGVDRTKVLDGTPAASVDWRVSGVAGRVKDQCSCGSCWTFGAISSIEGRYYLSQLRKAQAEGKTIHDVPFEELSEQQIVNCFWTDEGAHSGSPNLGCNGGMHEDAFYALIEEKSFKVARMNDVPYIGVDAFCGDAGDDKYTPTSWASVPKSVEQMKLAAMNGPVSLAVHVPPSFIFYASGVYNDRKCLPDVLAHAVSLEGYTTDSLTGKEVWIVKNSWSTHWGNDGYIYIEASDDNICGVLTSAAYVEY